MAYSTRACTWRWMLLSASCQPGSGSSLRREAPALAGAGLLTIATGDDLDELAELPLGQFAEQLYLFGLVSADHLVHAVINDQGQPTLRDYPLDRQAQPMDAHCYVRTYARLSFVRPSTS